MMPIVFHTMIVPAFFLTSSSVEKRKEKTRMSNMINNTPMMINIAIFNSGKRMTSYTPCARSAPFMTWVWLSMINPPAPEDQANLTAMKRALSKMIIPSIHRKSIFDPLTISSSVLLKNNL